MGFLIPNLSDIFDIIIIALVIYKIITTFEKTRTIQIMISILLILLFYFVATSFHLRMVTSILQSLKNFWILALIIIFQPEIRDLLTHSSQNITFSGIFRRANANIYAPILEAIGYMSQKRIGGLIVFEKNRKLEEFINSGEIVDAKVSAKLLLTIFNPKTMLHDGAVIIRKGKIHAVKVVLPLTKNIDHGRLFGTRHLAAIGISEMTDAFVIVVSEESGRISYARNGSLLTVQKLEELLPMIVDESR